MERKDIKEYLESNRELYESKQENMSSNEKLEIIQSARVLEDDLIRKISNNNFSYQGKEYSDQEEQESANFENSDVEEKKDNNEQIQEIVKRISINSHANNFLLFIAACERSKNFFGVIRK